MTHRMPRLVVFDLAGTTLQDDGAVAGLFQATLEAAGLAASAEAIAQVRGASKREAFRALAGDEALGGTLFRRFIEALRGHYAAQPPREVPGAAGVFRWLREQGVKVALNTGFDRDVVLFLLEGLGWRADSFDAIVCGDEVGQGRPSPELLQEAMRRTGITEAASVMAVGDTELDLRAGAAAGAGWVVGVTSGAHDHARLLTAPHTHLVASVAGIREVLR